MRRIGFLVYPGFQIMSLSVTAVLEMANQISEKPVYEIVVASEHGGLVATSIGVPVQTSQFGEAEFDTIIVGAASDILPSSPILLEFIREAEAGAARRVVTGCTGAFVLAEAGILNGRRATTHWRHARDLQRLYPEIMVDEDRIFIEDRKVWTSAGMTAAIDLALALVEDDLGVEIARSVAKAMVVYHRRAGGQSQFSSLLELAPKSDRIQSVLNYAKSHLASALTVEELAKVARLSPRQFSRAFSLETGQPPAKAIENLRVEAARLAIEDGRHNIDEVAQMTGFGDRDRMRRAFLRTLGQPPQVLRRNARLAKVLAAE
ncbi:AraC family transcriptional regulator [Rhodoblastus sphagnicola]|uniref:AraC family transcriptional regulator n=1 Tax=Rhodoblastus sphagnicola TaxID=333368 RepID=A0A2S6N0L8_9HYPH|nr:GlxA family transcriptional regulator [Rhodoblastus sphagnicola]MBB4200470.1 transcriptional regulator GlxA family with amidase domain [Rhodoblastus sphagnicola]PPQ28177.1 AraC family transcriptional regulator [Rhodoblastus sphagnicola]